MIFVKMFSELENNECNNVVFHTIGKNCEVNRVTMIHQYLTIHLIGPRKRKLLTKANRSPEHENVMADRKDKEAMRR